MSPPPASATGDRSLRLLPATLVLLGLAALLRAARQDAACDGLTGTGLVLLGLGWSRNGGLAWSRQRPDGSVLIAAGLLLMATGVAWRLTG